MGTVPSPAKGQCGNISSGNSRAWGSHSSQCQPQWLLAREVLRSAGRFGAAASPIRALLLHGVVVPLPERRQCGISWQQVCPGGSSHHCRGERVAPGDTQSSVRTERSPWVATRALWEWKNHPRGNPELCEDGRVTPEGTQSSVGTKGSPQVAPRALWAWRGHPKGHPELCGDRRVTPGDTQSSVGMEKGHPGCPQSSVGTGGSPQVAPRTLWGRHQAHSQPSPVWALRTCCPILPPSAKP